MYFFLSFFIICLASLFYQSSAVFAFSIFFWVIGNILVKALNDNKFYFTALKTFNIIFLIYFIVSCLRYIDIVNNYSIFLKGNDEIHYWAETISAANYTLKQIWNELLTGYHLEEGLYYFYIKSISSIAVTIFDGNNELLQILGTALPGSLVSVFLFGVFKKNNISNPLRKTLVYMTCMCLLPVSMIIHRDSIVALFYAISIYLCFCEKHKIANSILQLLLAFLTFFVREQSGLFLLLILFSSIYIRSKDSKIWGAIMLIVALIVVPYVSYIFDNLNETLDYYSKYAIENETSGLSRYIDNLPAGLKQIAQVIQGQFQPLPIWSKIPKPFTFISFLIGLWWAVISVYWFRIFTLFVVFLIKCRKNLNREIVVCSLVYILFIFLNCTNADPRRMVCMYPLCYFIFNYLKEKMNIKSSFIKKYDRLYYTGVVLLMLVIIILK